MAKDSGINLEAGILTAVAGSACGGVWTLWPWLALPLGKALAILCCGLADALIVVACVVFNQYRAILAGMDGDADPRDKATYLDLRRTLSAGGRFAPHYTRLLTSFMNAVDAFFGDKRPVPPGPGRWLKERAPLWTAPSFDRCLLLALLYPLFTIFVIWLISGDVGPAERALGLSGGVEAWKRALSAALFGFGVYAMGRVSDGPPGSAFWLSIGFSVVAAAVAVAGAGAGAFAFAAAAAFAVAFAAAVAVAVAFAAAGAVAGAVSGAVAGAGAVAVAVAGAVAGAAAVAGLNVAAIRVGRQGGFLTLFWPAMLGGTLALAHAFAAQPEWDKTGAFLFFFGLLTLLNAPFDWASLGLTRALLRKGIELDGVWPYLLALVDALAASLLIILMMMVTIAGVQTFDLAASAARPILPLGALIYDIKKHTGEAKYYWVYALLLTTMLPSVLNLTIGFVSLLRGIPGVPRWLLARMPDDQPVLERHRNVMAVMLTLQWGLAVLLALAVQSGLVWLIFWKLAPAIGGDLLGIASALVHYNLPLHIVQWLHR